MNTTNINIAVDSDIKEQAQNVFESVGIDMQTAINIFLTQTIEKNKIPLEGANIPRRRRRPPQFGCMKGKIWEAPDHDWFAPMEEFADYM